MAKKNITIDELAVMVQKGFSDVTAEMVTKAQLENEISGLKKWAEKRFDKIENIILDDYKERLEKVELEVKDLKDLLAFK